MGIEGLSAALAAEAERQEAAIWAEARRQSAHVLAEARAKAAAMEAEAARITARRQETQKALQGKKETIAARQRQADIENRFIGAVRERCAEKYRRWMASAEYAPFIHAELDKARLGLGGEFTVAADATTATAARKALGKGAKVSVDAAVKDGFVASSADGRMRVHCTFEARFEKLWKREAPGIVKRIAEAADDGV